MLIEQTKIASQLGISVKALKRILQVAGITDQYTIIDNKRHYELKEVIKIIQKASKG